MELSDVGGVILVALVAENCINGAPPLTRVNVPLLSEIPLLIDDAGQEVVTPPAWSMM